MRAEAEQTAARDRQRHLTARGEIKRWRILDAAAKVLARRGYAGTQLSEIAKEAGVQAGSFYYHFESREELIEEVLRQGATLSFARVRTVVEALPGSARALERLEAALRTHLQFQLAENDYARAAVRSIGQCPEDMWSRVNATFSAYGKFFDSLIVGAMKAGELDPAVDRSALRMLIFGAANWASEWYREDGSSSVDDISDLLVRLMLRGVGGFNAHETAGNGALAKKTRPRAASAVLKRSPRDRKGGLNNGSQRAKRKR